MRSILISDNNDTLVGMRLAGIEAVLAKTPEEISRAIDYVLQKPEFGILIVTETVFEKAREELMEIRMYRRSPLVVEVPDRHGQRRPDNYITQYINESVGIKL
ncbi:V-type ATP synthase subunit F [Filifactor villosus]|uniref:V-type ATP synthase subunit F n=1 Tax=Filifactor villosus TaxID=29374 RepID=A0ABV9QMN5_9FIRM